MRFSILIPSYDLPTELIHRCLDSIVNQQTKYGVKYTDYEVILVLAGETAIHNSQKELIARYYKNVKLFNPKNRQTVSETRNYCLDKAQGDWIVWCDADDYLQPFALDTLEDYIIQHQKEFNCFCYKANVDGEIEYKSGIIDNYVGDYVYCDISTSNIDFPKVPETLWTKCVSRKFIEDNHIRFRPEITLYDDWYFHNILCMYPLKAKKIDKALYNYVIREGSLSTDSEKNSKRDYILKIRDMLLEDLELIVQKRNFSNQVNESDGRHQKIVLDAFRNSIRDVFRSRIIKYCEDFVKV